MSHYWFSLRSGQVSTEALSTSVKYAQQWGPEDHQGPRWWGHSASKCSTPLHTCISPSDRSTERLRAGGVCSGSFFKAAWVWLPASPSYHSSSSLPRSLPAFANNPCSSLALVWQAVPLEPQWTSLPPEALCALLKLDCVWALCQSQE